MGKLPTPVPGCGASRGSRVNVCLKERTPVRNNQPVTQSEFDYPDDATLMVMTVN